MKKFIFMALCFCGFFSRVYGEGIAEDLSRLSAERDTGYALGMLLGDEFNQSGLKINYGAFTRGLRDAMENRETDFTIDEALSKIQAAYDAVRMSQVEENREKERQFFEANSGREGILTTSSGLQYEVIREGEGDRPDIADSVRVHYEGSLIDGTVFDSSYDRGEPAEFPLGGVIPGWTEGLQLMTEGSAYRLYIPSDLAYGEQGAGGVIPPSSPLIFDVELLEILPRDF